MMTAVEAFDFRQLDRILDGAWRRFATIEHPRDRPRDFRYIDVAVATDGDSMRRHKLIGGLTLAVVAELGEQSSVEAVNTHPRSEGLCPIPCRPKTVRPHPSPPGRAELADIAQLLRTGGIDKHSARQCHPGPDRLQPAVGRENLHAGVMPVGDVDIAIAVTADI